MGRKEVNTVAEFDEIVSRNKEHGKRWYHGLKGKWRRLSESEARDYIASLEEEENVLNNKIVLASTWNINCGIATYTRYLLDCIDKIMPDSFAVNPIIDSKLKYKNMGKLTHLQHEFGIVPKPLQINGKLIITWHTVSKHIEEAIEEYECNYDVVAHIVHSEYARLSISSNKDVFSIPHGSMLIPEFKKEDAKRLLGINIDMPIGFVFGFQSGDKNYKRLMDAARNTGIHIIISGAPHNSAGSIYIGNDANITFINRFLVENEVNLYALASDLLLFDYAAKDHNSVSGAMHRIIGAGRPVVCSDVKHFSDLEHDRDCLKFKDQEGLEKCIYNALQDTERLSAAAKDYAQRTSWENVARRHIDIYEKYLD